MELSDNLKKRLKSDITPQWWDDTGYVIYCDLAHKLIEKGFTEDDAIEFLRMAYSATSI